MLGQPVKSKSQQELNSGDAKEKREKDIEKYLKDELKINESLIAQDFNRELNQIIEIIEPITDFFKNIINEKTLEFLNKNNIPILQL